MLINSGDEWWWCLTERARRICQDDNRKEELLHIQDTFLKNGYPKHVITNNLRKKPKPQETTHDADEVDRATKRPSLFLSYVQGLSEKIQIACLKLKVRTIFKCSGTLRSVLTKVRTKIPELKMKGVVYKVPCQECEASYIGETGRSLQKRSRSTICCQNQRQKEQHCSACLGHGAPTWLGCSRGRGDRAPLLEEMHLGSDLDPEDTPDVQSGLRAESQRGLDHAHSLRPHPPTLPISHFNFTVPFNSHICHHSSPLFICMYRAFMLLLTKVSETETSKLMKSLLC